MTDDTRTKQVFFIVTGRLVLNWDANNPLRTLMS